MTRDQLEYAAICVSNGPVQNTEDMRRKSAALEWFAGLIEAEQKKREGEKED